MALEEVETIESRLVRVAIQTAVEAERDACAKIADKAAACWGGQHGRSVAYEIYEAIRARDKL